eukprot:TRINITY_DN34957_c0_g2_i1.p1 TRINITY_DN34957_c0_g2~~TRINITY_DN34957_c0_g2_i1.p1  ORF type:complete len:384 (-),score=64.43 TRINITY_DN34957_c0_g2_i1:104-1255(-)
MGGRASRRSRGEDGEDVIISVDEPTSPLASSDMDLLDADLSGEMAEYGLMDGTVTDSVSPAGLAMRSEEPAFQDPSSRFGVSGADLSSDILIRVAEELGATEQQQEFLKLWLEIVHDEVRDKEPPGPKSLGSWLHVTCDGSYFEFGTTGACKEMIRVARNLIEQVMPRSDDVRFRVISYLHDLTKDPEASNTSLWIKLKRIGDPANQSVDIGFSVVGLVDWTTCDVLVYGPQTRDLDVFRIQAEHNFLVPQVYASSLIDVNREQILQIQTQGAPPKCILQALFFFKALGFVKPEESAVSLLIGTQCSRCTIDCSLGPKGLTKLRLRLHKPRRQIPKRLALEVGAVYNEALMDKIISLVGSVESDVTDYFVESSGYKVGIGFTA